MKHTLTRHIQYNKRCKDGKSRSYILFFLDNTLIIKQKFPFDEHYSCGDGNRTSIHNVYILDGKIHQTRSVWKGCGIDHSDVKKRNVSFPLSKRKLKELGVLPDVKITE